MGPSRAEQGLGLSGVGEGLGMHWDATTLRLLGAEWGRVGRAGLGGVGHALGCN